MPKISNTMAVLLVTVAACFDGGQALSDFLHLIPVLGNILAFVINEGLNLLAIFSFYIWLKMLDVSFVDPKRALRFFGAFLGETIPVIDALPLWTTGIVLTILSVWVEEKTQKMAGLQTALNFYKKLQRK